MVKGLAHVQSINDHIGVEEQDRLTYVTSVLVSGHFTGLIAWEEAPVRKSALPSRSMRTYMRLIAWDALRSEMLRIRLTRFFLSWSMRPVAIASAIGAFILKCTTENAQHLK